MFDVAIVGAGIVGAACAFECSRAGLRAIVLESAFAGCGATAAGMGHLVVMDDSEAQFALTSYSCELWRGLIPQLSSEIEYVDCGTLWVAADDEEMEEVRRKERFYHERGVRVEILDERQLAEAEPNLRAGLCGALLVPGDAVLYPPRAATALLEAAGALVQTGKVVEIRESAASLADGSKVEARWVINAAGTRALELMNSLPLSIIPRKGHLVITDRYPGFVRHQLVELGYLKSAHASTADSVAFNVQPRSGGQILIGSSRQYGNTDSQVDSAILHAMLRRAIGYMPQIAKLSAIRSWTGFRAATPDKLPLIGLCPGYQRVYLATGHEGLGITTSLATGRLIVDQILGRESQIPIESYLPGRMCLAHA